jgi:hypothetical protein
VVSIFPFSLEICPSLPCYHQQFLILT